MAGRKVLKPPGAKKKRRYRPGWSGQIGAIVAGGIAIAAVAAAWGFDWGDTWDSNSAGRGGQDEGGLKICKMQIVAEYPHDKDAFTQGLLVHDGRMFESTGLYGHSDLREVDIETGQVIHKVDLDAKYFGEGLTVHNGRLLQLTWRENVMFEYDLDLNPIAQHSYAGEGWGLASQGDDQTLILTNGSSMFQYLDPTTKEVSGTTQVYYDDPHSTADTDVRRAVSHLNELELIDGRIYANVWGGDVILVIVPETGQVTHVLNLSTLPYYEELRKQKNEPRRDDVLNGIAFDEEKRKLYVTGKRWPVLYEVELPDFSSCEYMLKPGSSST